MPVIGRALLFSLGFADGAVHVQDNLPQVPAFPQLIDPFAGGVRKSGQIAGLCQHLGLEPCHRACRRCRMLCRRPPTTCLMTGSTASRSASLVSS